MKDGTDQNNVKYQHIGDISKALGVSSRTIRYYEELSLIVPKRSDGGYREYSDSEVEKLTTILRLKKLGMSLEEIKSLIRVKQCTVDKDSINGMSEQLHKRLHEFEGKLKEYRDGVKEIKTIINILNECSACSEQLGVHKCEQCLEEQNKEMPSLMKAML